MKQLVFVLLLLVAICPALFADELLTVAEKSNYTETATNEEVIQFCKDLAGLTTKVRFTILGKTTSGLEMPLLIVGNPAPARPADMIKDDRVVIYIQGNIHPGEIEGKEATLMLARDISTGKYQHLLDNVVLLIVPNYNVEGNANRSPDTRYYQPGPKIVGSRANAMNLDLNRDWVKQETPEARMVTTKIFNTWDPVLVIDCHTTNGSLHMEPMTWAPHMHPSCDDAIRNMTAWELLPYAADYLKEEFGHLSIPYGNFMDREDKTKGWRTFEPQPRYTTNYAGMRNRMSVLLESYVYAPYPDRVESTYGIILGMLDFVVKHKESIVEKIQAADSAAWDRATGVDAEKDALATEVELQACKTPVTIKTWEGRELYTDDQGRRRVRPTGEQVDLTVPYFGQFKVKKSVHIAQCYVLDRGELAAVKNVLGHGILVEELTSDVKTTISRFYTTDMKSSDYMYQGHVFTSVTGDWKEEEVTLPEGSYIISTAQPLGMLAAYLLEPESDDGLTTWNFFDRRLRAQWGRRFYPHPVLKIMKPLALPTKMVD